MEVFKIVDGKFGCYLKKRFVKICEKMKNSSFFHTSFIKYVETWRKEI